MYVATVLGDINPSDLGITLPHEHLLSDATCYCIEPDTEEKRRLAEAPVTMEMLGEIRRDVNLNRDNLIFNSADDAISEGAKYKMAGGNSLVEVTPIGFGRDPLAYRRVSLLTRLNVICATGWYISRTHPSYVSKASVDELADIMIKELTEGIDDTGIRAGVIGEIGCSKPLHPDEEKVLSAAAKAQARIGVPLTTHTSHPADKVIDIIEENDGLIEKVYLGHMDTLTVDRDLEYQKRFMDRGATILYDHFGSEAYYRDYGRYPGAPNTCTDVQRIDALVELCKQGYDKYIIVSHDICMKVQTTKYGGYGYVHILKHIIPILRYRGITDVQIRNVLVENPKRLFS